MPLSARRQFYEEEDARARSDWARLFGHTALGPVLLLSGALFFVVLADHPWLVIVPGAVVAWMVLRRCRRMVRPSRCH